ncbi:MAG: DNA/RNA helicase domain-containing protein, partial [Acidimicrobiales bacterium]
RRSRQHDPEQLLRNAYRVLLTRGRDGLVVWIPDDRRLDHIETALLAAGIRPMPGTADVAAYA